MKKLLTILLVLFTPCIGYATSVCYGTTSHGKLDGGIELPASGENFESYSSIARAMGRTYVHSEVKNIIVESYKQLYKQHPDKVFKFAETGFKSGGKFSPHKTHQNGLSVDFMVPVIDKNGNSVHLPTNPFNKFGYNIEFDSIGKYKSYKIDYEAMAAHIVSLHKTTQSKGFTIWRVIFDPVLQPYLLDTNYGGYIKKNIALSQKKSWVRHDEHYHVDFEIPCQPI